MTHTKGYYLTLINGLYDKLIAEHMQEHGNELDFEFGVALDDFGLNAETVVGYYLYYYGDDALNVWRLNTSYDAPNALDAEVSEILTNLFAALAV